MTAYLVQPPKQTKASERPNSFFTLKDPKTGREYPANPLRTWAVTQDTFQEYYDAGKIVFPDDYDFLNISNPVMRYFKDDDMAKAGEKFGRIAVSTKLPENVGMSLNGTKEITDLFDGKLFDFPKPSSLISFFLNTLHDNQALILDFFSGSATTAHAVMQLNAEDGGKRRYVCVQLPEETDEKSEARKAGFATIAEIAKERIRRAGAAISGSLKDGQRVDTGFKVFKLSESSFKQWRQPENIADLGTTMEMFVNAVQDNATPENMLYELMLRLGCKLTSPVEHKNGVYWVTDEDTGKRIALLLEAADQTLIDDVIAAAPAKVVALDKWFDGNDALKSNTVLQMKDAALCLSVCEAA